ncbi:MAG: radical SAM protein [Candidatus Cloacimonetes bacterium]|nr:radical SAM protein [Candidatus Cloacimonadota bacterium]
MAYKHLFGPVPSRRLGTSLGVDLVPLKVCSFNCIYCEVGATTNLTIQRKEYIPVDAVLTEVDDYLSHNPALDYITFSGAGEPTLNSGIGHIINYIKGRYPQYKLALITNSSLFGDAALRAEVSPVDLVLPSLDAVTPRVFAGLNRPNHAISIDAIVEGLIAFRQESDALMWLEIFLSPGINDTPEELTALKAACTRIQPHSIQLNTLDRPGTVSGLHPVSHEKLTEIVEFFKPLSAEIIAKSATRNQSTAFNTDIREQIIQTISRRPCTDVDLCEMLGLHINELNKYLGALVDEGIVFGRTEKRGTFFTLKK